jgi:glycosyltransferase involved in cell wall biosynthesis
VTPFAGTGIADASKYVRWPTNASRTAAPAGGSGYGRSASGTRSYDTALVRVAFLLQDLELSGGVGVVVEHATQLRRRHGIDAQLVMTKEQPRGPWAYRGLADVPVLPLEQAEREPWDIAVSTWWETALLLFRLDARRHVSFVQSVEERLQPRGWPERMTAAFTTALPVRFITEARWIAEMLEAWQPGNRVFYVRNGLAKDVFASPPHVPPAAERGPLRVVVEGARGAPLKGVDDAILALSLMTEPAFVTWVSPHPVDVPPPGVQRVVSRLTHAEMAELFYDNHVLLKLSRAEGMYGPPLEAFHMGSTVVTTAVTGHDEYVRHRENGLVVGWDDVHGTARALDLLARDRRLLHELRCGALQTARAWPDWEQSSQFMAMALRRIAAEPPPPARAAGLRMASDMVSSLSQAQYLQWLYNAERARAGGGPPLPTWRRAARRGRRVAGRVKRRLQR